MTYTPVIPTGGIGGFAYLKRTREAQQAALEASPQVQRNVAAFRERIASVASAEELVADRQLLTVALGAFGLGEDINSKYLIRKILESDPSDPKSLVSRYADKRYRALSESFGFGAAPGGQVRSEGFADRIVSRYADRQFEIAAGEVDGDMRLALAFGRDLNEVVNREGLSDNGKWFTIMATPPLRSVFETALGLPGSIGQLDLDRQLVDFRERAERVFGTSDVAELSDPKMQDRIVRDFLVRSQLKSIMSASYSPATAALALLNPGR
jgi:Protein of unknown function (DUF1217)